VSVLQQQQTISSRRQHHTGK